MFGLPAFSFTDPTLAAGSTLMQALHISELRAAMAGEYAAAGQAAELCRLDAYGDGHPRPGEPHP